VAETPTLPVFQSKLFSKKKLPLLPTDRPTTVLFCSLNLSVGFAGNKYGHKFRPSPPKKVALQNKK
jgi:hypothetical protein